MGSRPWLLIGSMIVSLNVYLFVSAPPPLLEETSVSATIPIEQVFVIAEAENDVVRSLWSEEIVGAGKKVGLQFSEDWRERGVEVGPLPALFLRETAKSLEKNPVRLGLYLGSDFPINSANRFEGIQKEKFNRIKETREPQFFYVEDTGQYTATFSDVAVAHSCVQCHNDHEQSPKHDWELSDVMGATTWSYPSQFVTLDEAIEIVAALRKGFNDAYSAYLDKTVSFSRQPKIGDKWPRDGYYLPTAEVFMDKVVKLVSTQTLQAIMLAANPQSTVSLMINSNNDG